MAEMGGWEGKRAKGKRQKAKVKRQEESGRFGSAWGSRGKLSGRNHRRGAEERGETGRDVLVAGRSRLLRGMAESTLEKSR